MKTKPLYEHDCDHCVFLGTYNGYADLYWCMQMGDRPTIIARYSNEAADYISGIPFRRCNPELAKAYVLALARGLDVPDPTDKNTVIITDPNNFNYN